MGVLLRDEAQERAALISVSGYDVALDLDQGDETFGSGVTISFSYREPGGSTFLDYGETGAGELLRGYVNRFFAELSVVPKKLGDMAAEKFVMAAFPHCAVEPAVATAARAAIEDPDNTPGVRRALVDSLDRLDRAIVVQDKFRTTPKQVHPAGRG